MRFFFFLQNSQTKRHKTITYFTKYKNPLMHEKIQTQQLKWKIKSKVAEALHMSKRCFCYICYTKLYLLHKTNFLCVFYAYLILRNARITIIRAGRESILLTSELVCSPTCSTSYFVIASSTLFDFIALNINLNFRSGSLFNTD